MPTAPVPPPRIAHHQEGQAVPLITPRETVTVDTGNLHTVVHTVRNAYHFDNVPFRPVIVQAAELLKEFLLIPCAAGLPTTEVFAEELWWAVQAADEIGCTYGLSPIGTLFEAVDHLGRALAEQAPATDCGLVAVVEAEITIAFAEQRKDSPRD